MPRACRCGCCASGERTGVDRAGARRGDGRRARTRRLRAPPRRPPLSLRPGHHGRRRHRRATPRATRTARQLSPRGAGGGHPRAPRRRADRPRAHRRLRSGSRTHRGVQDDALGHRTPARAPRAPAHGPAQALCGARRRGTGVLAAQARLPASRRRVVLARGGNGDAGGRRGLPRPHRRGLRGLAGPAARAHGPPRRGARGPRIPLRRVPGPPAPHGARRIPGVPGCRATAGRGADRERQDGVDAVLRVPRDGGRARRPRGLPDRPRHGAARRGGRARAVRCGGPRLGGDGDRQGPHLLPARHAVRPGALRVRPRLLRPHAAGARGVACPGARGAGTRGGRGARTRGMSVRAVPGRGGVDGRGDLRLQLRV